MPWKVGMMEITTEVSRVRVPRVGEAILTMTIDIDGVAVKSRRWLAVYVPAKKGAVPVRLADVGMEEVAQAAFVGAVAVLTAIGEAREKRKTAAVTP